jgi:two-component system, chemotaxis family, chemotaxis protein CheY
VALNVLVVDDSAVIRAMIIKTLKLAGVELGEAHEAANGQAGLEKLEGNWIDIAFVDINMPVMNGEEMIMKLRENPLWADLPVVVVSTEGSQTRIDRLLQKGVRFVHKPFAPEVVRQVILEITGANHGQIA